MEKVLTAGAKHEASLFDEWCKKKYPEKYDRFLFYKKAGKIYKLTHPDILADLIATMGEMNKELKEGNKIDDEARRPADDPTF